MDAEGSLSVIPKENETPVINSGLDCKIKCLK